MKCAITYLRTRGKVSFHTYVWRNPAGSQTFAKCWGDKHEQGMIPTLKESRAANLTGTITGLRSQDWDAVVHAKGFYKVQNNRSVLRYYYYFLSFIILKMPAELQSGLSPFKAVIVLP